MIRTTIRTVLLVTALVLLTVRSATAQEQAGPQLFFSRSLAFSHDEILQVGHGGVVAKILKSEKHEVAAVTVSRFNVSPEFFVAKFRDIRQHKKSEAVLQVGKFSNPPRAEDLRDLVLLPQEVNDLKNCRPGACNFKLSSQQIELIHRRVNFAAPDAAEQASAVLRQMLADYVRSYVAAGNRAMDHYNDKETSLDTATQFNQILDESPYLVEYAPEFCKYLRNYPNSPPPSVENFIYWSRENYGHGLKPVITITHVTILRRSVKAGPEVLVASKQIYASHYFEASLGLTLLFPTTESDPTPGIYLAYLNRSRIDLLRRWYGGLLRGTLSGGVQKSMRANMIEVKRKMESEYTAGQSARAGP